MITNEEVYKKFLLQEEYLGKEKAINMVNPIVSVRVNTYQHVGFIKECLDSILMQETSYPFEIIIGEDQSTDGTREICIDYAEKHPDKIRLFLRDRKITALYDDQQKFKKSLNATFSINSCRGKYLAACEGDDYWTDRFKLQTQVDYLENNSKCSACFHPVNWLEQKTMQSHIYSPSIEKAYYDENDVIQNILQSTTCSTVFNKSILKHLPQNSFEIPYGDVLMNIAYARNGFIGYINKPMATYRRHTGGAYSGASQYNRVLNTIKSLDYLNVEFDYHNNKHLQLRLRDLHKELAILKKQSDAIDNFKSALKYFNNGQFIIAEEMMSFYKTNIVYERFIGNENRSSFIPKVSVIIVAYNTNELLLECLSSLRKQSCDSFEIIVIDNGKNEKVEEEIREMALLYIQPPANLILSEGRNIGAHFAKGKILAFLDDDAIADENWVSGIISAFENNEIWGMRGKVLPKDNNALINTKPHYNLGDEFLLINYIDTEGNSAFLRKTYLEFLGMNPLLFGTEGFELSYRIQKQVGYGKLLYSPDVLIYHDYACRNDKLQTKTDRHNLMNDYLRWKYSDIENFRRPVYKSLRSSSDSGKEKFISICIPTHNRAVYLKEAIQSALNQNYNNYEIVIVDDGSTDNTKEVVENFNSEKIRYIFKENSGAPETRNRCITEAKGDFILWLDDDDLLVEDLINSYIKLLNNYPDSDVIYGELKSFGESDQHYKYQDWYHNNSGMIEFLYIGSPIPHPGSMIRKNVYKEIGNYDVSFKRAHDYQFWSRLAMAEKYNCKYLPKLVSHYRIHESNITGNLSKSTDYRYEADILKNVVDKIGIQKLFPRIDWEINTNSQIAAACIQLSVRFFKWNSIEFGVEFLLKSMDEAYSSVQEDMLNKILSFPNIEEQYPAIFKRLKKKKENWSINNGNEVPNSKFKKINGEDLTKSNYVNISMVTYNRLEFTKKSIESIIEFTTYPYVLTVIDNNSQDGTKEYLKELKEKGIIKNLVSLDENIGIAKASNLGWLQEPDANYYLKLDNDIVIQKHNWLSDMISVVEKIPQAGAVGYNFEPVSYASSFINEIEVRIKHKGNLGGACILIPKRTSELLGFWCEDYGLYGEEDADYCFRISLRSLLNIYMPNENIGIHLPGGKAAAIDQTTFTAADAEEEKQYKQYRLWKDEQRRKNADENGIFRKNLFSMAQGNRSLFYVTSSLKKESDTNKMLDKQKKFVGPVQSSFMKSIADIDVSIIIPVYNKLEYTKKCLNSIKNNTASGGINYEILIVDNNSTDGTKKYLHEQQKIHNKLRVIHNNDNLGFARANNLAASQALGSNIVFLNNDTEVQNGWHEALLKVQENDDKVGAVGSKLLYPDRTIQHAGVIILDNKEDEYPLIASNVFTNEPADLPQANEMRTYQALTAACLLVKKQAFFQAGGFDEGFWNGYEDVDLCFKLGELGYKLIYQPESVVIHHESKSGSERFSKVTENIKLLNEKWKDRVEPDFIVDENKTLIQTNAGKIKKYLSNNISGRKEKVSIITLTYNQLNYTKAFIDSVFQFTSIPFELIIVDNASNDDTVKYLKDLEKSDNKVKVIFNNENLGFPKGVNQALRIAEGNYFLIANNDIIVTENWLERMIQVSESNPQIGLVGPISNAVSGVQIDKEAKYNSIDEMHKYAASIKEKNKNQTFEFPRVAFLCTLIKKEVVDKIGGLDERFSPGNFEDDDFCLRAQLAGYKTVIAKDVFIHHFGSKSFTADGIKKYEERLEINKKIFIEKWGADPEEIWLHGKKINERNIMYPLKDDEFGKNIDRLQIFIEEKEYEAALRKINSLLENFDMQIAQQHNTSKLSLLNLAGNIALVSNKIELGRSFFERALNEDKESSTACAGLAECFFGEENYEAAKTMFENAINLDPNNKGAQEGLGKVINFLDNSVEEVNK